MRNTSDLRDQVLKQAWQGMNCMLTAFSFAPHDFWNDVLQNHAGLTLAGTEDGPPQYPGMYLSSSRGG